MSKLNERLLAKVRRFMEQEEISVREMSRRSSIPRSTLQSFLDEVSGRSISPQQARRLARAIDPFKGDLLVHATEMFKTLRRAAYGGEEIRVMARHLDRMGEMVDDPTGATLGHSGPP